MARGGNSFWSSSSAPATPATRSANGSRSSSPGPAFAVVPPPLPAAARALYEFCPDTPVRPPAEEGAGSPVETGNAAKQRNAKLEALASKRREKEEEEARNGRSRRPHGEHEEEEAQEDYSSDELRIGSLSESSSQGSTSLSDLSSDRPTLRRCTRHGSPKPEQLPKRTTRSTVQRKTKAAAHDSQQSDSDSEPDPLAVSQSDSADEVPYMRAKSSSDEAAQPKKGKGKGKAGSRAKRVVQSDSSGNSDFKDSGSEESESDDSLVMEVQMDMDEDGEDPLEKHWPTCQKCGEPPAPDAVERYEKQAARRAKRKSKKGKGQKGTSSTASHYTSSGRAHRAAIADEAGEEGGDDDPFTRSNADLEALGAWLECRTCSASIHWGCLNQERRTEILQEWNIEERARHNAITPRDENGKLTRPFFPRRTFEMDEMLDHVDCVICARASQGCMMCKADKSGKRSKARKENDGNGMMLDDAAMTGPSSQTAPADPGLTPPPPESPGNNLFRCSRCQRCSHYECLRRSAPEQSLDDVAGMHQRDDWKCHDCREWPVVEQILAWRPSAAASRKPEDASKARVVRSPRENLLREYLIKFSKVSFRATRWVSHSWLSAVSEPRLKNFLTDGSRIELEPPDALEQRAGAVGPSSPRKLNRTAGIVPLEERLTESGPPAPEPDAQERIPAAYKTPDRILDVYFQRSLVKSSSAAKGKRKGGGSKGKVDEEVHINEVEESLLEDSETSLPLVARCLVKWQDLGYEQCTWEAAPTPESVPDVYSDFTTAYKNYLTSRQVFIPSLTPKEYEKRDTRSLRSFKTLTTQPEYVKGGQLLDFQIEGVNWLRYGWHSHQPGILADEMGLGKTIQIITFLGSLYDERNIVPSLIVVPNSTIANWVREFEKWMPNLRVVPYFGEAESRRMIERYELFHEQHLPGRQALKAHVVLATDSSVRGDPGPLKKVQRWEVLIVDEGQNLKSGESNLLFRRLNELKIMHRVILSGTPLNNNIGELFNLLTFIDPDGEWSDIQELKKKYEVLTTELIDELQPKLKPYFLRRIKVGVLDLPPKKELIVPISLRPLQKRIYKSILEKNVEDIHALSETQGRAGKKKTTNLNNALMQLRKCIQHPYLIDPGLELFEGDKDYVAAESHQRLIDASAKLGLLERLLPKLHKRGHRILLFSQFVMNLDIVEAFMDGEGYKYLRLDGSTGQKQRQKGIDAFNAPDSEIFVYLLSTRAAGVGINLASADTVIIFDPDFNPHVDIQAIARAHRIGQTKKVLVLSLMCKGTAEEQIIENAKKKMVLDHLIVQNLENEENRPETLEGILKFGAQALFAEGGVEESEKDVKFTDDDLDRLLDRTETEEAPTEEGRSASLSGQFSFARVWERDNARIAEEEEGALVGDQDFWADILAKQKEAEEARVAAEKAMEGRGARRRKQMYNLAATSADNSGEGKKSKDKAKSRKGKEKAASSTTSLKWPDTDVDFVAPAVEEESESDGSVVDLGAQDEVEALLMVDKPKKKENRRRKDPVRFVAPASQPAQHVQGTTGPAGMSAGQALPPGTYAHVAPPSTVPGSNALSSTTNAQLQSIKSQVQKFLAERAQMSAAGGQARTQAPAPALPLATAPNGHAQIARPNPPPMPVAPQGDPSRAVYDALSPSSYDAGLLRLHLPNIPAQKPRDLLTVKQAAYFAALLSVPIERFPLAFSIVSDRVVPKSITQLPHDGAGLLQPARIRQILEKSGALLPYQVNVFPGISYNLAIYLGISRDMHLLNQHVLVQWWTSPELLGIWVQRISLARDPYLLNAARFVEVQADMSVRMSAFFIVEAHYLNRVQFGERSTVPQMPPAQAGQHSIGTPQASPSDSLSRVTQRNLMQIASAGPSTSAISPGQPGHAAPRSVQQQATPAQVTQVQQPVQNRQASNSAASVSAAPSHPAIASPPFVPPSLRPSKLPQESVVLAEVSGSTSSGDARSDGNPPSTKTKDKQRQEDAREDGNASSAKTTGKQRQQHRQEAALSSSLQMNGGLSDGPAPSVISSKRRTTTDAGATLDADLSFDTGDTPTPDLAPANDENDEVVRRWENLKSNGWISPGSNIGAALERSPKRRKAASSTVTNSVTPTSKSNVSAARPSSSFRDPTSSGPVSKATVLAARPPSSSGVPATTPVAKATAPKQKEIIDLISDDDEPSAPPQARVADPATSTNANRARSDITPSSAAAPTPAPAPAPAQTQAVRESSRESDDSISTPPPATAPPAVSAPGMQPPKSAPRSQFAVLESSSQKRRASSSSSPEPSSSPPKRRRPSVIAGPFSSSTPTSKSARTPYPASQPLPSAKANQSPRSGTAGAPSSSQGSSGAFYNGKMGVRWQNPKALMAAHKCCICGRSFHVMAKCPTMANLEEAEARLAEMRQDVAQDKEKDVNLSRMVNMMASWIDGKRRRAQSVSTSSR